MRARMYLEVTLRRERFATDVATEWTVSRVSSHVNLQRAGAGERLTTDSARMFLNAAHTHAVTCGTIRFDAFRYRGLSRQRPQLQVD